MALIYKLYKMQRTFKDGRTDTATASGSAGLSALAHTTRLILFLLILTASPAMAGRDSVYVSTSPNAYAYHRTLKCEGLQHTTRKIIKIPRQQAERSRRPCRYCYRREVIAIGGEIKGDSIVSGD